MSGGCPRWPLGHNDKQIYQDLIPRFFNRVSKEYSIIQFKSLMFEAEKSITKADLVVFQNLISLAWLRLETHMTRHLKGNALYFKGKSKLITLRYHKILKI